MVRHDNDRNVLLRIIYDPPLNVGSFLLPDFGFHFNFMRHTFEIYVKVLQLPKVGGKSRYRYIV